jgi:hypothetical protein
LNACFGTAGPSWHIRCHDDLHAGCDFIEITGGKNFGSLQAVENLDEIAFLNSQRDVLLTDGATASTGTART